MSSRILYILCHDDRSEATAHSEFDKYIWARIYRIPDEIQNHLMEGVMFQSELMKLYDEWKDKDYVGILTYKLPMRFRVRGIGTMEAVDYNIVHSKSETHKFIKFVTYDNAYVDAYPHLRKILTDTANTCNLTHTYTTNVSSGILRIPKPVVNTLSIFDKLPFCFHNCWMTTPVLMLQYIQVYNQLWIPALESHPLVWTDSTYDYSLEPDERKLRMLKLNRGKADFCPYHPLANERFTNLYFYNRNIGDATLC